MDAAAKKRRTFRSGFSLMEVAVSIGLAAAIALAAMGVRYHAVRHAKRADVYSGAGRLGLLLIEGWRSSADPSAYDPVLRFTGQMPIKTSATGPDVPKGFTGLGTYHVALNGIHYYATLAYIDETAGEPPVLHVNVGWRRRYGTGDVALDGDFLGLTTYH